MRTILETAIAKELATPESAKGSGHVQVGEVIEPSAQEPGKTSIVIRREHEDFLLSSDKGGEPLFFLKGAVRITDDFLTESFRILVCGNFILGERGGNPEDKLRMFPSHGPQELKEPCFTPIQSPDSQKVRFGRSETAERYWKDPGFFLCLGSYSGDEEG